MSVPHMCATGHAYELHRDRSDLLWCHRCGETKQVQSAPTPAADKYRHYIADQDTVGAGGVMRSLCGKVYEPADDDAEVLRSPCPDCSYALTDGVWTS